MMPFRLDHNSEDWGYLYVDHIISVNLYKSVATGIVTRIFLWYYKLIIHTVKRDLLEYEPDCSLIIVKYPSIALTFKEFIEWTH